MRYTIPLCLAAIFLAAGFAQAKIPGADDPKAYTEHDYRREVLEYNLRTTLEAYKEVGHRDPKWDADAKRLLQSVAERMSNVNADRMYRKDVPTLPDLYETGQSVIRNGCDDPLVLDMYCVVLHDSGRQQQMKPLLRKALDGLLSSKYSVTRATNCARRALKLITAKSDPEAYAKFDQILYDANLASIKFNDLRGIERRYLFNNIAEDIKRWPVDRSTQFFADAQAAGADPWLTQMIGAAYHMRAAWLARGGGYADTVTPQGWKLFFEHFNDAKPCLMEAYKLRPDLPEAADRMIQVTMGLNESEADTLRGWFDRAVAAQFDYEPAYNDFVFAMMPRWHGDHQAMYEFGLECAQTGRYDTRVPMQFVEILCRIRDDCANQYDFWHSARAFGKVKEVLERYAAQQQRPDDSGFYDSQIAGFAWQLGRFADARAAIDKTNGNYVSGGFLTTHAIATRAVSGIYAFTGEVGENMKRAEAQIDAGKIDEAIEAYKLIGAEVTDKNPAAAWIRGRPRELHWQKTFNSSVWIDLMPGADLAGWYVEGGKFTADGNSIVGTSDAGGARMICGVTFGPRWELRGTVEIVAAAEGAAIPETADAGAVFNHVAGSQFCGFYVMPQAQRA